MLPSCMNLYIEMNRGISYDTYMQSDVVWLSWTSWIFFCRVEQSVYALLRTRDMAISRYREFGIPVNWLMDSGIVGKVTVSWLESESSHHIMLKTKSIWLIFTRFQYSFFKSPTWVSVLINISILHTDQAIICAISKEVHEACRNRAWYT